MPNDPFSLGAVWPPQTNLNQRMTPADSASPDRPATGSAQRTIRLVAWVFFGGLSVVVIGIVTAIVLARGPGLPPLTRANFDAAQQRWRDYKLNTYRAQISVSGPQPAMYVVEVVQGEPTAAWRNGDPLKQPRTWATWSVPGMFDTIQSDLLAIEQGRPGLVVRCLFDADYGYPIKYQRIDTENRSEVNWTILSVTDMRP